MKLEQEAAVEAVKAKGGKVQLKRYSVGDAWSVDLSGQTIDDQTFELLRRMGPISELNLSRSTFSDSHAAQLNEMEVSGFLVKLDISQTGFSDAGLAELTGINLLQELIVTGSKVTKQGADNYRKMRQQNPKAPFRKLFKITM